MLLILAVAIAYASTNFDNLAVMLALTPSVGMRRAATAFVSTQALVIVLALAIGAAADSLPVDWLGLFGLVPIGIGVLELGKMWRRRGSGGDDIPVARPTDLIALMVMFSGLSMDSFALTTAFLADSAAQYDGQILMGAVLSLAVVTVAAALAARVATKAQTVVEKLNRITPFIMIASGIYILAPTFTDAI